MGSRKHLENAKALLPTYSITCDRPRLTCVIDPTLALSRYGVPLVKQLAEVMEMWVVREFWHIIDKPAFYLQQPKLVAPRGTSDQRTPEQERTVLEETRRSLREWERFRIETDLARLNLFWIGDSPGESYLPKNRNLEIFRRWESIANSLDDRLNLLPSTDYSLPLAFRDTAALAVSLGSAFILTHQLPVDFAQNLPPEICQFLENWGIPCQTLTPQDAIVAMERNYLHQLLIHTGTAKFLWAGVNLTVLHLLIPASEVQIVPGLQTGSPAIDAEPVDEPKQRSSPWVGARGFWYSI